MTDPALDSLCDPVLIACGIEHGFGQRGSQLPDFTIFPEQVHGIEVFEVESANATAKVPKADIILSAKPGI